MKTTSTHTLVVTGTVSLGLVCLAATGRDVAGFERLFADPIQLTVWIALLGAASLAPLPLPSGGRGFSFAPAFEFAALVVFGLAPAAWLTVLSRLVMGTQARWTPLPRNIFRLGEGLFAVTASGFAYLALGGHVGAGLLAGPHQGIALVTAGGTYVFVSQLSHALLAGSAGDGSQNGRTDVLVRGVLGNVLLLFLGVFIGYVSIHLGPPGAGLFFLPVAATGYAGRLRANAEAAHLEAVRSLMAAVDAADPFTRGHSYRISKMCVRLGRHLGMDEAEVRELEYAGLLHDIGRTALQRELSSKPGRLTKEEQSAVRHHPRVGADWIRRSGFFPGAARLVELHHEQPDGKGYPQGMRGTAIPLGSRIIMGVAAFDAMTSDRPYRKGLSPEEAFDELLSNTGTQFFSAVVEALIELYSKGALFDDFEEGVLEHYRDGEGSSRALERFLSRSTPVPRKRGMGALGDDGDVPVIEFPADKIESAAMDEQIEMTAGAALRLQVASRSDVGCVRTNNEDSFGVFDGEFPEQGALLVLADGMGGAAAGEVASRMAVESLRDGYFEATVGASPPEALRRAMESANAAIYSRAVADPDLKGMGTTCTAAVVVDGALHIGHVGDSRAYLVDEDDIRILTRDHTLAAELAGMGGGRGGAPEGARNVLTRCLGNQAEVQIDVFDRPVPLHAGNVLILCSDGLSNLVNPDEILTTVSRRDPARACEDLVALARDRGAPDNITVQVARVGAA